VQWRITLFALGWLALISALHYALNSAPKARTVVRMGYMPVIANLAAPILDFASKDRQDIRFLAIKFPSFSEMAEALRNDRIQAAFIIAPLAVVLRQQGVDVKVVYIGNRHESTLVARADLNARSIADLKGKTLAVPIRYSGHHLCVLDWLEKNHMEGDIRIVEMNPPDMASAMASGALDAYFVGEPFAAQSLKARESTRVLYVEENWPGFICNLMIVKNQLIHDEPATVQALVEGAARSGVWAGNHIAEAAEIASQYWNQPLDLVAYALSTPPNRIRFDRFTPDQGELDAIAARMAHFGLISDGNAQGLADPSFARRSRLDEPGTVRDILKPR